MKNILNVSTGLLKCVMDIEHVGKRNWHPDVYEELRNKKKVEAIQILLDVAKYGDRPDGLDSFWLPMYEYAQSSSDALADLTEYLITYDTLPFVCWNSAENEDVAEALMDLEDRELLACLSCAKYYFMCTLKNIQPLNKHYLELIEIIKNLD